MFFGLLLPVAFVAGIVAATLTLALSDDTPKDGSAEAGFARDMSVHHAQAVTMANMVEDTSPNSDVREFAENIAVTQQQEVGRMRGWLDAWGLPVETQRASMEWMGMAGQPMPGMATEAQLGELDSLGPGAADALFLRLMIDHHVGGVEMARAAVDRVSVPMVRDFASSMVDVQREEIAMMRELLKGETAIEPAEPGVRDV